MTTTERRDRWCGSWEPPAFERWAADRAAGCGPHLVPVVQVGRCPSGHLAVEVLRPTTRTLDETLDGLGVPTEGVAVTLTVPLLQLAASARQGALELGAVPTDGVGVDDAGAVIVADRPAGGAPICADAGGVVPEVPTAPSDPDGARQLVLAARAVWDRVDARAPARNTVDPALDAARDGDAALVSEALALVLAAAPPRPVRLARSTAASLDAALGPAVTPSAAGDLGALVVRIVREVLEHGIPLGRTRRLPVRHAVVGVVVAGGLVSAALGVR
ncbi:hypothetical protein [Curtobacterium caseinilyticum]|uniref:DUF2877 domain-containing protein n=1 Tax=Curtobacterium caseinilyticum TaxID=3055137 RepID=A0ABT7TQ06_9MICO|nr:hypothetical protein [Curtobacterium caseinilyticum]MDM7891680.1 hypothetical protein [Curtobacterium caseinilyticum]